MRPDLLPEFPGGAAQTSWLPLVAIIACVALAAASGLYWLIGFLAARSPLPDARREGSRRLPLLWRWGAPLIEPLSVHLAPWLSARTRFALTERLRRAGFESLLGVERFIAGRLVAAGLGVTAITLAYSAAGTTPFFAACLGGFIGYCLPGTWLADHLQARQRSILRELPFYLDVITLAVESGLNLSSALAQAADKGPAGPLREEFDRVLRDLRAGRLRAEALRAMADRLALPAVGSLVAALVVAEQQGGALAPLLRAQAEQRRTERFQRAEKLAMEAPVKMLLPLLVFIFPCTFVILMFPILGRLLMEGWLS